MKRLCFHDLTLEKKKHIKVTQGGGIVKEKIKGEQQERLERMENDLKKWRAEDAEKEKEAAAAKKD